MRLVTVLNKCCRFKFFVFKKVKFSDREKRYNAWGLIYKTINSKGLKYMKLSCYTIDRWIIFIKNINQSLVQSY